MPGKSRSPDQISEAVCLRAAGYTVPAISERLGLSIRTLHRLFEHHGVKKGALKSDLVEAAKRDLIEGVTSNERIKEEAARMVADDLAHTRLLRARMADASEHLVATNLDEAALVMRAAAAYSTALKNTSDTLRHSMRTEKALEAHDAVDMPELVVTEITNEEAITMRPDVLDDADDGSPVGDEVVEEKG